MFKKRKEYKAGRWRWLSCKASDTVLITYGRSLVILLTKMKVLFTFYNKEGHNHSYEKNKTHLHVSTACVRWRGVFPLRNRSCTWTPAEALREAQPSTKSTPPFLDLEVMSGFVTTSFQGKHIQKLIPLSFHSNPFFCMVLLKKNSS